MNKINPRPIALIILDGWGYRKSTDHNAIAKAKKPHWDKWWGSYPHALISGSGKCVGLPDGQMGNSEVGHLNMGAGRIVHQDFTRIDAAIENGEFFKNSVLVNAFQQAKLTNKAVHIMGLLSPGGVHSHEQHLYAATRLAAQAGVHSVYLHAFLDGRDTPPRSAMASLETLNSLCEELHCCQIASIIGRYYAMDRDQRWDRIQQAYDLLTQGKSEYTANSPMEALSLAYDRGENDEFVKATSIHAKTSHPITIENGDIVVYMNFRADRARELTQSFIDSEFSSFTRSYWPKLGAFICLTQYDKRFDTPVVFHPLSLKNIFAEYISSLGLKQLRIAETEKYAHVTFFFNGGVEPAFPGEDRILIPSPKVATYDLQPAMSAEEITQRLVEEIKNQKYDVIICNFANADMVGHSGNLDATVSAIETLDTCLAKIISALQAVGGEALITADHGNAECMFDEKTKQPHTAHTSDPVPLLYIGREAKFLNIEGKLSDIAPTLLYLMGLSPPLEMTGTPLLKLV